MVKTEEDRMILYAKKTRRLCQSCLVLFSREQHSLTLFLVSAVVHVLLLYSEGQTETTFIRPCNEEAGTKQCTAKSGLSAGKDGGFAPLGGITE